VITVDHVIPVALGGPDDPSNLVAACKDCNGGKSSVPADAPLVDDVASDAIRWANAMRLAADELNAKDDAIESIIDAVHDGWKPRYIPTGWEASVVTFVKAGLDQEALVYLAGIAAFGRGIDDRWSYFCGCCWKRIRQMQDRAQELLTAEDNPPQPTLSTRWTADEIREYESDAIEYARDQFAVGDEAMARMLQSDTLSPCRHNVVRHCGDPICAVEDAAYMTGAACLVKQRNEHDEAVIKEAEELLDD
jgi:hypothetical protein